LPVLLTLLAGGGGAGRLAGGGCRPGSIGGERRTGAGRETEGVGRETEEREGGGKIYISVGPTICSCDGGEKMKEDGCGRREYEGKNLDD
jgi:hypothetical protein